MRCNFLRLPLKLVKMSMKHLHLLGRKLKIKVLVCHMVVVSRWLLVQAWLLNSKERRKDAADYEGDDGGNG